VGIFAISASGDLIQLANVSASGSEASLTVEITQTIPKLFIDGLDGALSVSLFEDAATTSASLEPAEFDGGNFIGISALSNPGGYFDVNSTTSENATSLFLRTNPHSSSGVWQALNKTTKVPSGFAYTYAGTASSGGPNIFIPTNASGSSIGVKDGLVVACGSLVDQSSNNIVRIPYDEELDMYIFDQDDPTQETALYSAGQRHPVEYMDHIDTFVTCSNSGGTLYYSADDGLSWTAGGSVGSFSDAHLKYDKEAQTLIIRESASTNQNTIYYLTDPTQNAATWSLPTTRGYWYVPVYNATGGFWTLCYKDANGTSYTTATTGGSWSSVSINLNTSLQGMPIVHGGRTYIVVGQINSTSGDVAKYSTDGTTWTGIAGANTYTYQGYARTTGNYWAFVDQNRFIKWPQSDSSSSGYCFDTQDDIMYTAGPIFDPSYNQIVRSNDGKWFAFSSSRFSVSIDGHRWRGSSYTTWNTATKYWNNKFWSCINSSYQAYSVQVNPDTSYTITQEPNYSSGYSPQALVFSGSEYAIAPSQSTSYNSGYTVDGGESWGNFNTFNYPVASNKGDGSFYGWYDSPNQVAKFKSGNLTPLQDEGGSYLTNIEYCYRALPWGDGALLFYMSSNNLTTAYCYDNTYVLRTFNIANIFPESSWDGMGPVWKVGNTVFLELFYNNNNSSTLQRTRVISSADGGQSWSGSLELTTRNKPQDFKITVDVGSNINKDYGDDAAYVLPPNNLSNYTTHSGFRKTVYEAKAAIKES